MSIEDDIYSALVAALVEAERHGRLARLGDPSNRQEDALAIRRGVAELRRIVEALPIRYVACNDGSIVEGFVVWDPEWEGGGYVDCGPTPSGVGRMRITVSRSYSTREAAELALETS